MAYNVKQIGFMSGIFGTSIGALSALAGRIPGKAAWPQTFYVSLSAYSPVSSLLVLVS